jgi:hypothetical protein
MVNYGSTFPEIYDTWKDAIAPGTSYPGWADYGTANSSAIINYSWVTASGTGVQTERGDSKDIKVDSKDRGIHPRLYFKYVKSKMTKLQKSRLEERLSKLKKLVIQTKELGQQALYENFAKNLVSVVRESEAEACGIEYIILRETIDKYRHKIREGVTIELDELKDYDRVIPAGVVERIKECWKLGLFHTYWVLHVDHKEKEDIGGERKKETLETTKQKIKEKDPLLLGSYSEDPDKFYFIADWIDEHCDLTLARFLEDVREGDPVYQLDRVPEMDQDVLKDMMKEVSRRKRRLEQTNAHNYKDLMKEEEREKLPTVDKRGIKKISSERFFLISERLRQRIPIEKVRSPLSFVYRRVKEFSTWVKRITRR